ncbi:cytochrome P450 [Zychaea mexicana]|uniref:cytochrome P450 n=1 Tax=Zychaea mexicana TaxID=64656 RepID=UPI0022FF19B5|nr:cytochrome P450 [Zychaea mexicana]KAI9491492.1 cytochrome P450 [Zychaea mexicana]
MSSSSDALLFVRNATLAGAAALGLLALKYNDRALFTEKREGMPFAPGDPIFGGLIHQLKNKNRLLDDILDTMEKYNTLTFYATALGLTPNIMTIDPRNVTYLLKDNFSNYVKGPIMLSAMGDLFGHGIFVANGEQWKYQRKAASLIFNVVNFRDHFTELEFLSHKIFDKKAESGKPIDFHDVIYKFTLDSFVYLGFGKQIHALGSKEKVPFAASFDICQSNCFERFIDPFTNLRDALRPIFHPGSLRIKQHLRVIDDFAYTLISERREQLKSGQEYKDLLSRFMNARNENNQTLGDRELRDTVLNFIIAGRDTTAQALSWTFYNLMLHPRIEAKLVAEIHEYLPVEDTIESLEAPKLYEIIKKMTYAHAVFYEVLRLHPSVPTNVKVALEDDVFPDGSPVKKGDSISWSPYAMGRSRQLWGPDARSFRPERWITETGGLRRENAGQWPAFHAGPRICLGQELATLESLVAIVMLLKRYKFSLVPNQEITYDISLTHPMRYGMQVFVERR